MKNFLHRKVCSFLKDRSCKNPIYCHIPLLAVSFILMTGFGYAQTSITGQVTSAADGTPLPGVAVLFKGTTYGTITDIEGSYTLNVEDPNGILVFSFVGFITEEVPINNRSRVDISLVQDITELSEVVVVGYGTKKKENLSGAVDMVDAKAFENRQVSNLGEGLQGLIPNLNITRNSGRANDGPDFNIRGFTSLTGGSPLILVDNIPISQDNLVNLNPNDIESVTVLKDAASAAVYGARAAFGVILIKTKAAKSDELSVSANVVYGVRTLGKTPDIVSDPYLAMKYKHEAAWPLYNLYPEASRDYAKQRSENPSLPAVIIDPENPQSWQYVGSTNWLDEIYTSTAPSYTANMNISKRDDKLSYYLSGGYYRQEGMFRYGNDILNRYNVRGKANMRVTDWLQIGNNTAYANKSYERPYYNEWLFFHNANRTNSLDVPKNPDGSWTSAGAGLLGRLQNGGRNNTLENDILTKFDVEVSLIKDIWSFKADAAFHRISAESRSYDVPISFTSGPDQPEQFTGANPSFAQNNSAYTRHDTYNIYTDFHKSFADKHYLQAVVGFNQEHQVYGDNWINKTQVITPNLPSIGLATGSYNGDETISEWSLRGVFYRLNYIFNDRYIVEFNGRYDGSSRFPKNDRFGFFPSASAAWVISNESFMEGLSNSIDLDHFKIRASYGSLGNQQVNDYAYIPEMSSGQIGQILGGERPIMVGAPGLVAQSLTWETVESLNFGTDLSFFNGQLDFNFDVYSRKTKDMLIKGKTLPAVLGTDEPNINAGDLVTRGWELRLSWSDHFQAAGSPFNYGIMLNLSDSRSEITRYDNPTGYLQDYYQGQQLGEIWGLTNDGFFQTEDELSQLDQTAVGSDDQGYLFYVGDLKFSDLNGDGKIDPGNMTLANPGDFRVIGNSSPRYLYGANLSASWKGFDIRVFIQGVGKKDWYPEASNHYFWGIYAQPWANVQQHNLDHWTKENPDGYFPRVKSYIAENVSELGIPQTRYLQNAAYLRVKNLTLGYTLPASVLQTAGIRNLRFYISAENLFGISHLKAELDPEVVGATGSSTTTTYPFQRTFSLGVNFDL